MTFKTHPTINIITTVKGSFTAVLLCAGLMLIHSCRSKPVLFYAKDERTIDIGNDSTWKKAIRKFALNFNRYRQQHNLPVLPDSFYLVSSGEDNVIWRSSRGRYPGLFEKYIVWRNGDTSLFSEVSVIKGRQEEMLIFRYQREFPDSFIENYQALGKDYRKENDSFFKRFYSYIGSDTSPRRRIEKYAYDSILHSWGISGN